jgi:hypothetical protein
MVVSEGPNEYGLEGSQDYAMQASAEKISAR